ncbi:2-dehydropantoate 2-reductase [Seleniivibrio woodruffii]|uniref:2-dehydropantoate 2-reductase n=1 Tax=Seleniivibrio woodruffii TaxID=1078050 RepID=UPI0039E40AD1
MFSNKRILIAGAGAIGSFYGGLMSRAGYDVELMARGKHLRAMQESGVLTIKSWKYGEPVIPVKAVSEPSGRYGVIILCVKSQDTDTACVQLKDHLAEDGCILSFQNGVENPDVVAKHFGADRTLGASLFVGLWIDPAGTVNHTSTGECVFGGWNKKAQKFEQPLKEIFDRSEIFSTVSDDIKYTLWSKLVWNVAYNPLSALLESTCGPMMKTPLIFELIEKMVRETVAAAKLEGATIPEEEWRDKIKYREQLEKYKTSMLQDIEKLKNPEIDGILGPVIRTLEKHGLSAPYCETVFRTVQFKYGGHYLYTPKLTADVIARKGNSILLIERMNEPFGWAIPGGFVDYGEKVEDAAVRELFEETGIKTDSIELLGIYSDPKRDKRGHTATAVYFTDTEQEPKAGDDAKNAAFFPLDSLPDNLAFDHKQIISDYIKKVYI